MGRCYYWLTVSFNPPEIIGEIWRPCSKLSDLNRIMFLHHRRTHHSIHPCPRGRAGPARSQHASCNRRLKPLLASAVEIISTPVRSVQLVAQRVRKEASRRVVNKCKFSATAWAPTLATVPVGTPTSLSKSSGTVDIKGIQVKALWQW